MPLSWGLVHRNPPTCPPLQRFCHFVGGGGFLLGSVEQKDLWLSVFSGLGKRRVRDSIANFPGELELELDSRRRKEESKKRRESKKM